MTLSNADCLQKLTPINLGVPLCRPDNKKKIYSRLVWEWLILLLPLASFKLTFEATVSRVIIVKDRCIKPGTIKK